MIHTHTHTLTHSLTHKYIYAHAYTHIDVCTSVTHAWAKERLMVLLIEIQGLVFRVKGFGSGECAGYTCA